MPELSDFVGISRYQIEKEIDKGTFSQVLLAKNEHGIPVVIKKISKLRVGREAVLREVKAGRLLRFIEGVPAFHEVVEDSTHHYLVFEHVPGPNLYWFMEQRDMRPVEEDKAREMFRQLLKTVMHAHARGVYHLDLKLENIMLDDAGNVKVIDWGLCDFSTGSDEDALPGNFSGSIEYCCQQVLRRQPYCRKNADAFSLGVVLYLLLFAQFPWSRQEKLAASKSDQSLVLTFPARVPVSLSADRKSVV